MKNTLIAFFILGIMAGCSQESAPADQPVIEDAVLQDTVVVDSVEVEAVEVASVQD